MAQYSKGSKITTQQENIKHCVTPGWPLQCEMEGWKVCEDIWPVEFCWAMSTTDYIPILPLQILLFTHQGIRHAAVHLTICHLPRSTVITAGVVYLVGVPSVICFIPVVSFCLKPAASYIAELELQDHWVSGSAE